MYSKGATHKKKEHRSAQVPVCDVVLKEGSSIIATGHDEENYHSDILSI